MESIPIQTQQTRELIDISAEVRDCVRRSGARSGLCVVYCPHTTAGVTINENADPDVVHDLLMGLDRLVPANWPWRHVEGNSDAHLKSSLVGCSRQLLIEEGELVLGTWQGVFFCEFDGPRKRTVHVGVLKDGV
jgi:secondary thiamine-phosphate synthase enzyme